MARMPRIHWMCPDAPGPEGETFGQSRAVTLEKGLALTRVSPWYALDRNPDGPDEGTAEDTAVDTGETLTDAEMNPSLVPLEPTPESAPLAEETS